MSKARLDQPSCVADHTCDDLCVILSSNHAEAGFSALRLIAAALFR
jgi:hypothetical protein